MEFSDVLKEAKKQEYVNRFGAVYGAGCIEVVRSLDAMKLRGLTDGDVHDLLIVLAKYYPKPKAKKE